MRISNGRAIALGGLATVAAAGGITCLVIRHLQLCNQWHKPLAIGTAGVGLAGLAVALWPTQGKNSDSAEGGTSSWSIESEDSTKEYITSDDEGLVDAESPTLTDSDAPANSGSEAFKEIISEIAAEIVDEIEIPTGNDAYISTNTDAKRVPETDAWHPEYQTQRITDAGGKPPFVEKREGWVMVALTGPNEAPTLRSTVLLPSSWLNEIGDGEELQLRVDGKLTYKQVHWLLADSEGQLISIPAGDCWVSVGGIDYGNTRDTYLPASLLEKSPVPFLLGKKEVQLNLDQGLRAWPGADSVDRALQECGMRAHSAQRISYHERLSHQAVRFNFKKGGTLGAAQPFWPSIDDPESETPAILQPFSRPAIDVKPLHKNYRLWEYPGGRGFSLVVEAALEINVEQDCHLIGDGKRVYVAVHRQCLEPTNATVVENWLEPDLVYALQLQEALPEKIASTVWTRSRGMLWITIKSQ